MRGEGCENQHLWRGRSASCKFRRALVQQCNVVPDFQEARRIENAREPALVGMHPGAVGGLERRREPRGRLVAISSPGNDLTEQRVITVRHRVAGGEARVHAHRFHPRPLQQLQLAGAGQEAPLGILGADACLDSVPLKAHLLL